MEFNSNPSVMAYDSNEESEYVAKNEDKHKKKRRKRANASKSSKKQEKSKKMKAALVNYADQDKSRVRTKELTAQQQNNCFKALEDFSDEGSLEKVSEKGDEEFIPSYM
uniref:Uncharacterized protein n=1 Tax=Euplotes crassus TaxID=5936 RepID=A0A7S3NS71_EUPCR|mmetsp:Transcript_11656/g.11589  ORF Transcript_11656/g.11589 Transcript_11656/m.11589 type:complete len:109 (+) Transcript_11656:877-1203(+)